MKEENKTAFFLTERELSLLLAAKGIHVFQGLPLQHMPFTQQDILQTLLALNKKGLLDGTEEGFQAAPEISACFVAECKRGFESDAAGPGEAPALLLSGRKGVGYGALSSPAGDF